MTCADAPAKINLRGVRYTASGFVLTHQRRFSLPSPTELTFRSHPGHMGKWLLKLSITHNSCADRGAQPDIGETGQAAPHHDVPRRRIIGAREVSA